MLDGKDIIDVGCGLGHLLSYIIAAYEPNSISGTEIDDSIVRSALQRLPGASIFVHNIEESGFDNTYDIVFCTEVLEHLYHPDKALFHMLEATRKNGIVFLTATDERMDTYEGHINFWSEESWKVFIEKYAENYDRKTGRMKSCYLYAIIK